MGDVAQILGVGKKDVAAPSPAPAPKPSLNPPPNNKSIQSTKSSFSKPVLDILSSSKSLGSESAPLPPIAPAMVKVNNKFIQTGKKARSWCWAPFSSGARNDGLMLHHWVRAGVEYPEYPFARFDIHLDALSYREHHEDGDGFYKEFLHDDNWTQSETDTLLDLCRVYELRWPVIIDRWVGKFGSISNKKVEDLQHRYYTIGMILNRRLVEKAAKLEAENLAKALAASQSKGIMSNSGMDGIADANTKESLRAQHAVVSTIASSSSKAISKMVGNVNASMQPSILATNNGTTNQPTFDIETERQRRQIVEKIWQRSKEEENEEEALRVELKLVEAQLRKLKKSGGHILAASAVSGGSKAATPNSSRGPSPVPAASATAGADASFAMLDKQFSSTAPIPTPGTPYLQSGRLANPATGGQMTINKTTLKRMDQILKELKINDRPTPTKRVCDVYDHVRKGVLVLLTLQKVMLKKETEVASRRNRLEKIAGVTLAREIAAKAEAASAHAARIAKEKAEAEEKAKAKPKGGGTKKGGGAKKATKKKSAGDKAAGTKRKSTSKKGAASKALASKAPTSKVPVTKAPVGTAVVKSTPGATLAKAPTPVATGSAPPIASMPTAVDPDGQKPKKRAKKS